MVENHWYAACAASELHHDRPLSRRIGNRSIALFRDDKGAPFALLDRCCHRGLPLSNGGVVGGQVRCGYHGWRFDAAGECVAIPSQPSDIPISKRYRVTSFPCRELDAFIWIWLGEQEPATLSAFPEAATGRWLQGSRVIRCNHILALENSFDMVHPYFVHSAHPAALRARQYGLEPVKYELRSDEHGCVVFTPPTAAESEPIPAPAFQMSFSLPGKIRFAVPTRAGTYHTLFFVTPIDQSSCYMHWLVTDPEPPTGATHGIRWDGEGGTITDEDQRILELVQQTFESEGRSYERSVGADIPTVMLRRIVQAAQRDDTNPESLRSRQTLCVMTASREMTG